MSERIINAERIEQIINVFGSFDENIKRIEQTYGVKITNRGTELKISGEDEAADRAGRAIEGLLLLAAKGETIDEQKVRYLIDLVSSGNEDKIGEMAKDVVCITAKGRPVKAKTLGQQRYMKAISKNTITIGVGPAGTGKTYLAVAAAVAAFREKAVNRIILTRPAVEAGERLGFLPGDLQNKVDPYLRPLYDALYDMLGAETYQKYLERGNIEVAPLAYMRGRTLDDSFIILDEAQNTSREQMKMFLTRIGFGSHVVITGDVTQIDLPSDKPSGLKEAIRILDGIDDIAICRLTGADVVRHALVQKIIAAYEQDEKQKEKRAVAAAKKPAARKTTVRKKA
ncbi:MAG: PhoH family protein [Oscillospiraceae bacterium]